MIPGSPPFGGILTELIAKLAAPQSIEKESEQKEKATGLPPLAQAILKKLNRTPSYHRSTESMRRKAWSHQKSNQKYPFVSTIAVYKSKNDCQDKSQAEAIGEWRQKHNRPCRTNVDGTEVFMLIAGINSLELLIKAERTIIIFITTENTQPCRTIVSNKCCYILNDQELANQSAC